MLSRSLTFVLISLGLVASAFADGRLEEVRNRFNAVQQSYDKTKNYLDKSNTDDGRAAAKELNENANKVTAFTQDIKDRLEQLGVPALKSMWENVTNPANLLAIDSANLAINIGKGDHSSYLSKVTEDFLKLGDSLKVAYDKFKEFGKNLQIICDSCR